MRTILFFQTFIILTMTTLSPVSAQAQTTDEQAILNFLEDMAHAFEQRDVPAIMACYVEKPLVVMQPGMPITDRVQLEALFTDMLSAPEPPQMRFGKHEVLVNGDQAMHLSTWNLTGLTADGKPLKDGGLSAVFLERQANGQWLITVDQPYAGHLQNN